MTCRELLALEHPDKVGKPHYVGGCAGCPHDYGYLERPHNCGGSSNCWECWDREIPSKTPFTYEHTTEPVGKVTELATNDSGVTATIKKEKNMTTKKTKAELMEELENVKNAKTELEKELANLERYKQYEEMADEMKAVHSAFVKSGFSDNQAFEMVRMVLQTAMSQQFGKSAVRR